MANLAGDEKPLWEFLGSAGHVIPTSKRSQIRQDLLRPPAKRNFVMATLMGWHTGAFVTPDMIYGSNNGRIEAQFPAAIDRRKWKGRGELYDWRKQVGAICDGNPLLRFAVTVAFVPPVLRLLGLPTVGFSFVGDPSLGKSSALALAGSVWGGNPERRLGFCETLLKTANAFDKVGRRYRHALLLMDETHLAPAQVLADLVHRLAAGETKETAVGEELPTHTALIYMITSNQPLAEILTMHKVPFDESYTARLIEMRVSGPQGMFHHLPDGATAHEFSERIVKSIADQYGTAIARYLTRLTADYAEDKERLVAWMRARMTWIERRLRIDGNIPGEARRGQYFCLAYAAGCLASRYHAVPWSRREIAKAVRVAYRAHRKLINRTATNQADPIKPVRRYVKAHGDAFIDVRQHANLTDEEIAAAPAFVIPRQHGGQEFAFVPKTFDKTFDGHADIALRNLKAQGLLRHDKGKLTVKYPLGSNARRVRLYCIKSGVMARAAEGA